MFKHAKNILISLLLLLFLTSCKVPDPDRFLMFINEKNDFLLQREYLHDSVNTSFIPVDCLSDVSFNNKNQQIIDNYNIDGSIVFLYSNIKVPADVASQFATANKDD